MGAAKAVSAEAAAQLRGCKVFAVDTAVWAAGGTEVQSLGALARLLDHFVPLSENRRLSRLGVALNGCHLAFVPEQQLLVEIAVHIGSELRCTRKLRVPSTTRLSQLSRALEQNLRDNPLPNNPSLECGHCIWALADAEDGDGKPVSAASPGPAQEAPQKPWQVAVAAVKGKRKSFGGSADAAAGSAEKRRRTSVQEFSAEDFVGDIRALHPAGPKVLPAHYLCPISFDIMSDPVLVAGSGNTYDRKSIEHHFTHKHTDPLSNVELRRPPDRKLHPNNILRSQIDEAVRSQVDIRLAAFLGEQQRGACSGDAAMAAYLGWCTSWLRGST